MAFQDEILEDLCSVQYGFDSRGRYQVEPKEKIKEKLGGRSPDLGDALLMACYVAKPAVAGWVESRPVRQADALLSGYSQ